MKLFDKITAKAKNDAGERIESLRFSVPALRVGVLEYGAGQLQTGNSELEGKPVKLYYPPEAVSDEKFLKSLETAPVVVGGHDSTTNEQNKKIDGWAHNVFFDKSLNAAMIAGVVKGAKEVAYIKGNLGASGFGASAFVDIFNLKVENGVTPEGLEYNAIANDLRATHVALAPHVRDPENKIKVTNAVCVQNTGEMMEVENAEAPDKNGKPLKIGDTASHYKFGKGKIVSVDTKSYSVPHVSFVPEEGAFKGEKIFKLSAEFVKNSHGEKFNKEVESMEPKEIAALVKNAVEDAIAAKNSEDRMGALEERVDKIGNALNEINEKLDGKKAESENAAFEGKETPEEEAEEKKAEEKEGASIGNAKPSQDVVKAFATAYNVDFGGKTPSFKTLGGLAGVIETDPVKLIAAVNTKFKEMQGTAQNTESRPASSVEVF